MRLEAATRIDAASNLFTSESARVRNDQPENQEKSGKKQAEVGITTTDAGTQTEITLNSIKDLEEAVARTEREKEELVECTKKEKITKELTLESFQANDIKVKFYTDLSSFLTMRILFYFIAPNVKEHHRSSLSH